MASLLVNIDVEDLSRAVRFYTEALGLAVGRRLGDDVVELLGAGVPIYLLAKPGGSKPVPGGSEPRDYRRHWTPVHLDFAVDDLQAALQRASAAGATREGDVTEHPWGKLATLADPFGNGFCLLQLTGPGYDAIATTPSG